MQVVIASVVGVVVAGASACTGVSAGLKVVRVNSGAVEGRVEKTHLSSLKLIINSSPAPANGSDSLPQSECIN